MATLRRERAPGYGVRPPTLLREALAMNGPGPTLPSRPAGDLPAACGVSDEVLAKAGAIVERLSVEYPAHASRDLARLEAAAARMAGDRSSARHYGDITCIAHDIRGQGATFGYPLMSRLAGSLCRAVRALGPGDAAATTIVRSHIAGMRAVLRHGITGEDSRPALRIAAALELLVRARTGW